MTAIAPVALGQLIDPSTFGNPTVDGLNMMGGIWRRASAQAVPNNVATTISFDTEDYDTEGTEGVPGTSFAVTEPGLWHITWATFTTALVNNRHIAQLLLTSAIAGSSAEWRANGYGESVCMGSIAVLLNAGDSVTVTVVQASGGSLNYTAKLQMWRGIVAP